MREFDKNAKRIRISAGPQEDFIAGPLRED
jgi:hypothetical protein